MAYTLNSQFALDPNLGYYHIILGPYCLKRSFQLHGSNRDPTFPTVSCTGAVTQ